MERQKERPREWRQGAARARHVRTAAKDDVVGKQDAARRGNFYLSAPCELEGSH